jgi:AcrR family transcriptional regulator
MAEAMPDRILASARALFLEHGFAATSVQQIAAHAGATKRTLYVKVGDKEALFRTVIDEVFSDWRHTVSAAGANGSLQARLEKVGLQLLQALLVPDMVRLNRVLLSEAYRFPSLVETLVQQIELGPIPQLARLLMEERGAEGTPTLPDEIAARLLYDMISGAPWRMALTGRRPKFVMSNADWVRHAIRMFLDGWQATPGLAARRQAGAAE